MAGTARAMGATLTGTQKLLGKFKSFINSFLISILRPTHSQTAQLHQHSPLPNRLIYNKSGVLRQHHQAL